MCGIFGSIDTQGHKQSWAAENKLREIMLHRGPDDFGVEEIDDHPNVVLAHNRLSIIDLSKSGRQPLSNEDGTIWITFNGEIYNYQPLRDELIQKGHVFRTKTDTEVLVHLYEEYGFNCLDKINGMFAFGIWDKNEKRLFLARDRLGVKPLVYFSDNKTFAFSSEIKALKGHPKINFEMDWEGLELYFTFNFIPAPWTIFKGVKKLLPGHYLVFENSTVKDVKYWDVKKSDIQVSSFDEASERLRHLVSDATKIRLRSDVPLGAFLSGGIDSSVVVANMVKNSASKIQTYFLGYKDDDLFDETPFARAVSEMYDTDHHEIRLSHGDVLDIIPEVLSSFDEPFADSSALPTFVVSREIRKHVTVALSGDGGDEIFGGYRRYLAEIYVNLYLKIPEMLRKGIIQPIVGNLPDSKGNRLLEIFRRMKIFINGAAGDRRDMHYSWMTLFPDKERREILSDDVLINFSELGKKTISGLDGLYGKDSINQSLYKDLKFLLPGDMLTKVDWMSMQNSLEVRSPLLDYRVAKFGFQLPGNFKVKPTELKYILRKAFENQIPELLWNRKKQGFEIPVGEWFKKEPKLRESFWELLNANHKYFKVKGVEKLFDEHLKNRHDNTHKLWAIYTFCWWLQGEYGVDSL